MIRTTAICRTATGIQWSVCTDFLFFSSELPSMDEYYFLVFDRHPIEPRQPEFILSNKRTSGMFFIQLGASSCIPFFSTVSQETVGVEATLEAIYLSKCQIQNQTHHSNIKIHLHHLVSSRHDTCILGWYENTGLILGLCPANERCRYKATPAVSHWLGANLESALKYIYWDWILTIYSNQHSVNEVEYRYTS